MASSAASAELKQGAAELATERKDDSNRPPVAALPAETADTPEPMDTAQSNKRGLPDSDLDAEELLDQEDYEKSRALKANRLPGGGKARLPRADGHGACNENGNTTSTDRTDGGAPAGYHGETKPRQSNRSSGSGWWQRGGRNDRNDRSDRNSSGQQQTEITKMLVRICLRQEDQLSILKQDTAFAIQIRLDMVLKSEQAQAEAMKQGLMDANQEFRYMQWNSETGTYQPKPDRDHWAAEDVAQDLRKLTGEIQGEVLPFFLEISNRSQEAQLAYLVVERMCHSGVLHLIGGSLRHEKLGRSVLAQSLEKALERL
ncbi:unnamed protein product, partial [Symbiodinium sp. CCMP2456]